MPDNDEHGNLTPDPAATSSMIAGGWALSWPSCASQPVWAPDLPEITPRPAQAI